MRNRFECSRFNQVISQVRTSTILYKYSILLELILRRWMKANNPLEKQRGVLLTMMILLKKYYTKPLRLELDDAQKRKRIKALAALYVYLVTKYGISPQCHNVSAQVSNAVKRVSTQRDKR